MNFKLNIIAHKEIFFDFYNLNKKNLTFYVPKGFNVTTETRDKLVKKINDNNYNLIEEYKLKGYNQEIQNKPCMSLSFLYHSYLNPEYINFDYLGMMEYDINITLLKNDSLNYNLDYSVDTNNFNFENCINEIININKNNNFFIFLSCRHKFFNLYKDNIKIDNQHWFDFILNDYNKRFNKNHSKFEVIKFIGNKYCPLQQSFITNKHLFNKISKYTYDFITEYINLESQPRMSTVLERAIMMFLLLEEDCKKYYIPLKHEAVGYQLKYKYDK